MNKCLKKIFIVALALCCTLSVQFSVSAIDFGDVNFEDLQQWITNIFPSTTATAENPDNTTTTTESTTAPVQDETTTAVTTTDIVNNSGTGAITTTTTETTTAYNTTYYYQPGYNYTPVTETTTIEPAGDEDTSLSFEASLSGLFEDDSAAVIVQTPIEPYTIGGLVVKDGNNDDDDFTWQKAALVAAAVLFVVLLALVVALLIQRSKRAKEDEYIGVQTGNSEPSGPVPVEVMTPERIAELLGAAATKNSADSYSEMSSEDSAAAIKAAALMGQLNSYSDPLIRKYTDEPVMISPSAAAALDIESATAADVLKATDSMLDDITGDEKFASDISGYKDSVSFDSEIEKKSGEPRICPDCGNSVPADDVFCHNCGTYIG